jgi:hypothetical protein
MRARHPLTGKEIRIISMDTPIWRDRKTLAWLDELPSDTSRWGRVDIGVTSTAAAEVVAAAGLHPDVVVCLDEAAAAAAWLLTPRAAATRILVIPKSLIEYMGYDKLLGIGLKNMMCIDEIHGLYPFVGAAWDGTVNDAKVLLALVLHFGQTFPVEPTTRNTFSLRLHGSAANKQPQPLWLVTQYYRPGPTQRRQEIDTCLKKNIACDLIDRVVLLNETACADSFRSPKLEELVIKKRLTYADVIRWIYEKAPADILVTFANADIYFDDASLRLLWSTDLQDVPKFLALLRWDDVPGKEPALFGPRADSQDAWILSSSAVKAVEWDWAALNFPFGKGGCDNAITVEMFKKRFLVSNPAMTLKTYHLHNSGVRNYNPRDIVEKPAYLHIEPTGLHDMRPVANLETVGTVVPFTPAAFKRRIQGPLTSLQKRTFCAMINRKFEGKIFLDAEGDNMWSPSATNLYKIKGVFQTVEGLVYTYDSILLGKSTASKRAWSTCQLSTLSSSIKAGTTVIAPLPDAVMADKGRYTLEYLSKIFLMREQSECEGFWCTKDQEAVDILRLFSWPRQQIPVLTRDSGQAWCEEGLVWPYQDTFETFVSREELAALRKAVALGGWKEEVSTDYYVAVVDGTWLTDAMVERLEVRAPVRCVWPGRTSMEVCLKTMLGAKGMIVFDRAYMSWVWALPRGAEVWEIQSEMDPSMACLHTCAAAELDHRLVIVPKGEPTVADLAVLEEKLLGGMPAPVTKIHDLYMPIDTVGFFGHAGDSFRETAAAWEKRGYVRIQRAPVKQVWLGGVGEVLLYDRPNYDWLNAAPPAERQWKLALFGNPAPAPEPNTKAWTFWPRRPELVEEIVAAGTPSRTWEARPKDIVFYGRSENSVQLSRRKRKDFDWSAVCTEFIHIEGPNPYPFTHKEYLERLTLAKYGLCLAGYGFKCHREIECMAMGCVPIVAAEVDMTNYADPPQEGLHYLRVESPGDVTGLLKKIGADQWMLMSVACRDWWRRNASVDGAWELTTRLIQSV